jgi:hypothetical protein
LKASGNLSFAFRSDVLSGCSVKANFLKDFSISCFVASLETHRSFLALSESISVLGCLWEEILADLNIYVFRVLYPAEGIIRSLVERYGLYASIFLPTKHR